MGADKAKRKKDAESREKSQEHSAKQHRKDQEMADKEYHKQAKERKKKRDANERAYKKQAAGKVVEGHLHIKETYPHNHDHEWDLSKTGPTTHWCSTAKGAVPCRVLNKEERSIASWFVGDEESNEIQSNDLESTHALQAGTKAEDLERR